MAPQPIREHSLVQFLLRRAKNGETKISVDADLWGEECAAQAEGGRFTGTFMRWINKTDLRVKIKWPDGDGTHGLEELIQHRLAIELQSVRREVIVVPASVRHLRQAHLVLLVDVWRVCSCASAACARPPRRSPLPRHPQA